jgi:hypothetical protein
MNAPPKDYFVGLDLGQARDPSAVSVVQRSWAEWRNPGEQYPRLVSYYEVGYLSRWPLGTSYPDIVRDVCSLVRKRPLDCPVLALDATGVGRPIVDLVREASIQAHLKPILITGGHVTNLTDSGFLCVPKVELVSIVKVILDSTRLQIADVPDREIAIKELSTFRQKITAAANMTFESWRDGAHDDLVFSIALPLWIAERQMPPPAGISSFETPPRDDRPDRDRSVFDEGRDVDYYSRRGRFGYGGYSGSSDLPPGFDWR